MKVKPTTLKNSEYVAELHFDSKSGIPHIHLLANRIDKDGNVQSDSYINTRAMMAAMMISKERGWKSTLEISEENKRFIYANIIMTLERMPFFTWDNFVKALKQDYDYDVKLRRDTQNKVVGYSVKRRNSIYNALDIGRDITAAHIEATWRKLHKVDEEDLKTSDNAMKIPSLKPKERNEQHIVHPSIKPKHKEEKPSANLVTHAISVSNTVYSINLPKHIDDILNQEVQQIIDDIDNKEDNDFDPIMKTAELMENIFNTAALLFVGYVDAATTIVETHGGGGGPAPTRDKKDDDDEWARLCARAARHLLKPAKTIRRSRRR